ncbi:MAG TPA: sulfurtransferase [Capsulimonadaceae bacterium]|jgi:thiosulfate/3-mercaptopyruvate sulfurtransferase
MAAYSNPEVLVSTEWVAEHGTDPGVRLVEVDVDFALYEQGHIAGAVGWNWSTDLNDHLTRDIVDKETFAKLASAAGIANNTTVVLYGDANNWFAAWAFWQFKIYGHKDVRLLNGGRKKWELESRPYTTDVPVHESTIYTPSDPDFSIRAFRDYVKENLGSVNLVDVRSPDEYSGKVIAPPGLSETAQRGGHIPGAKSIPWALAANEDGTFKSATALQELYEGRGVLPGKETIAYCRIGERSSHTWFVLKYLLGYDNVRNYDGSWTEWGSVVGAPIER